MSTQKRVYFAGKFDLLKSEGISLKDRLVNDYRSIILGGAGKLTLASDDVRTTNGVRYMGPFYCEQASNGDFTSTDCDVVIENEYESVMKSDIYLVVFDDKKFAVGSVVELEWAIEQGKEIIIFYKETAKGDYTIQSDYWFAISDASHRGRLVQIYSYTNMQDVINTILDGRIFEHEV